MKLEKTTMVWMRHGQARSDDGSYDNRTPLSELGRRQAEFLADALAAEPPPDAVYASPYPRAISTGEPFCRKLGVEAKVDERIAEFEIPLPSFEQIEERPDIVIWRPDHTAVEDGETIGEFASRVADFCEEAVERHSGETIFIFAHSGTIDAAIRWSLGFSSDSPWQHDFDIMNASITEIDFWPNGRDPNGSPRYTAMRRIGDATHLGDLATEM